MSSASTAAIESSRSMIVVTAASSSTSATPAGSDRPISFSRSIRISACSWLLVSRIASGSIARPAIADELPGPPELGLAPVGQRRHQAPMRHDIARHLRMAAAHQRRRLVQERLGPGDHAFAARRIITAARGPVAERIGAVERVVERAPAGVRRVQRIAGIGDRHHELRPGHAGDLGIDARRLDTEIRPLGQQVADLLQKGAIGLRVGAARVLAVPGVDPPLQLGAVLEQHPVLRPEIVDQAAQAPPEGCRIDAGAGQRPALDELRQLGRDLQPLALDPIHSPCHR